MTLPDRLSGWYYPLHDGQPLRLPSVTSILTAVAKPALVNWAASQPR